MKTIRLLILVFLVIPAFTVAQESELFKFLKSIPGIEIEKKDTSAFKEFYVIMLPQLVDHSNPEGSHFKQRIFVGHQGFDKPTVMETEGYDADWMNPKIKTEITRLVKGNQLYIEHRFFGASTPSPVDWKFLTAEQDAADYHYVRILFGQIYKGKWIASGSSKGGQTAVEYKVFYPDDVDVTLPYVAPINYERLDRRIDKHFNTVGTKHDRKQIKDIQFYLLKNKSLVLPEWENIAASAGYKFTFIDQESAYDYSVLEFPFSFWQYTADASKLPDLKTTSPGKMAKYLYQIVSPGNYTDVESSYEPAFYQFYTQLGYYEYNEKPYRKYLKNKDYSNYVFVPKDIDIVWDPSYQAKLKKFISNSPEHMIFIYGEYDPWGATAAEIKPGSGSLKMVQAHGNHGAQIASLSKEQREQVIETLEKWLEIKIQ